MGLSSLNAATKKVLVIVVIVIAVVAVGWYTYHRYRVEQAMKYPKFYSGNGRLEATEVYVSAKNGGRIEQIFVKEGDLVRKGDKLVQMQTDTLEAELKSVKAEIVMAEATIKQKEIALTNANREYLRLKGLLEKNATSEQKYDNAETAYLSAKANLEYAQGQLKKQQAEKERVEADIKDALLVAKYDGRIQDLLAHEGEVLSSGGRAMNLIALTDVYMTFFLPTSIAGKVKLGAEVKLIFDAAPDFPIDAKVTFIDPVAQFTPKSVETQVEREKLMFRIKASIDPERLLKHLELVKTGIPGVAWVKLDSDAKWEECPVKINLNAGLPPALEKTKQTSVKTTAEKSAAKPAENTKQQTAQTVTSPAEQKK